MNITMDALATFIILWGIPTFMVVRAYLKMDAEERKSVIKDFSSLRSILTIGFMVIGGFIAHLGTLIAISIIKLAGIVLFTLGGIFSIADLWKDSKPKSLLILALVSLVIFFNVD